MRNGLIIAVFLATNACIAKGRFDDAVAQTERGRVELSARQAELQHATADNERLGKELAVALANAQTRESALAAHEAKLHRIVRRLEADYREIADELRVEIGNSTVRVATAGTFMVLRLPDDALFEELGVDIKAAATRALSAVAAVLRSHPTWSFQVSGLTDDALIKSPRFRNGLELATLRAARIVAFLVEQGVARNHLCVAGYADLPSFSSDIIDGHDFNRRIEIVLAPDLADFE